VQVLAAEPMIEAARAAFAAGRLAEAEATCLALAQSEQPQALHLLALIRFQSGRRDEAVKLLQRAVRAAPGLAAAHNDLGAMLIALGRAYEAVATLRTAVDLVPDNAEARVNFANALHAQGELEAAEEAYRAALHLDARHVRGNISLGNLLCQLRRPEEALAFLASAATLEPASAMAHQFLGNALRDAGRCDEAVASYRRALELEPASAVANENLGLLLMGQGRYEEAMLLLNAAGAHFARANALQCLLRLGRYDEFFADIARHRDEAATNLHSASLSAYAAYHLGQRDPHPFCPGPLEQVRVVDRYVGPGADAEFLRDLVAEASRVHAVWEPRGITTRKGYQTGGNIFDYGFPALARLHREMCEEMCRYRDDLTATMTMVSRWPGTMRLRGWFVRLVTGGHQYFHNHPDGWLTGCLYLQMPTAAPAGEGAIEFGLESGSYPPLSDKPPPTVLHQPRAGQVAFFPSSLYHRTIPFSSAEERLCIAFDLLPG